MSVSTIRISEHDEQANFVTEVKLLFGLREDFYELLFFSVLNGAWLGGRNRYALMEKYKKEGFLTGVSDILYLQPRGDYNCLAIEMKARDKSESDVSKDQAEFLASVNAAGGVGEVCFGCDQAMAVFAWYMSLEAR